MKLPVKHGWKLSDLLPEGLLKIRGEVKKSDAVATLLATKAIQNQLVDTSLNRGNSCCVCWQRLGKIYRDHSAASGPPVLCVDHPTDSQLRHTDL